MDGGAWCAAVHRVARSRTQLSDFTFTFHFHALEKEMATHSSVLAWRIPGTGEPGGLSMGSQRVGHNRSDFAAAAATHSKYNVLESSPNPGWWKNCLPWNWSPVPKSLGTAALKGYTWSLEQWKMNSSWRKKRGPHKKEPFEKGTLSWSPSNRPSFSFFSIGPWCWLPPAPPLQSTYSLTQVCSWAHCQAEHSYTVSPSVST